MMKCILVIIGFVVLFTVCIVGVVRFKKLLKEDQDDFENANYKDSEKEDSQSK